MALRHGMSCLIDALGDGLPKDCIQFNSPVQGLATQGAKWSVKIQQNDSGQNDFRREESDAVILAAPARAASRILGSVDPVISQTLGEIQYASCAVVSLGFRRDQIRHDMRSFGFVVPSIEHRNLLSCSFSSKKYEGRAPEGSVLLRVFIGGALQADLLRQTDDQLIELAHREIASLLDIQGDPVLSQMTRQTHAMPQYHVGHNTRISKINDRLEQLPTLAFAGSWLNGVGIPGCIESGQAAAERVVAAFGEGSAR